MRRIPVMIACMAILTACSVPEAGTAKPEKVAATSSTNAKPSSNRPREIKLEGKSPCDLLTAEQLARIAKTTAPRAGASEAFKSPECTFNATGAVWRVTLVLTEGIDSWTDGQRQGQPTDIPPIAGFPAITITLPGDSVRCDVAVDVADGQYLYVAFEVSESFVDSFPKPCDGARQIAEAAMQNLTK